VRCRWGRLFRRRWLLRWRRVSIGWLQRRHLIRSDERRTGKRVSVGLLQHRKRVLERLDNVLKEQPGRASSSSSPKMSRQVYKPLGGR